MAEPLESLTLRLSFDDKLSAEIRAAAAVLTAQGRGMAQAIQPVQEALVRLDKDGRASLERLAVGAQESAAAVQKSVAEIGAAAGGGGGVGRQIGQGFEEGAKGVGLLDASAARLTGTLTGLAAGYVSVSKAIEVANAAVEESRRTEAAFERIPLSLRQSTEEARAFREELQAISVDRGIPFEQVAAAANQAISEGARSVEQVRAILIPALDLASGKFGQLGENAKLVSGFLGAFQIDARNSASETGKLASVLDATGAAAGQLAAGLERVGPKARSVGAASDDVLALTNFLKASGLTLEATFRNLDQLFEQLFTPEIQRSAREFGVEISKQAIEARGLIPILQDLSVGYGLGSAGAGDLTERNSGLRRILDLVRKDTDGLTEAQKRLADGQGELSRRIRESSGSLATFEAQIRAIGGSALTELGDALRVKVLTELAVARSLLQAVNIGVPEGLAEKQARTDRERLEALAKTGDEAARLELRLEGARSRAEELAQAVGRLESARKSVGLFQPVIPGIGTGLEAFEELKRQAAAAQAEVTDLSAALSSLKSPPPIEVRVEPLFDFQAAVTTREVRQFQEQAADALSRIALPPIAVGFTLDLPENVQAAAETIQKALGDPRLISEQAEAIKAAFADLDKFAASQERIAQAQAQAAQLTAQLNSKTLDGLERQRAEQEVQLAGIQAVINGLREQGVNVDALTAAFERLRTVERRRSEEAIAAQAKQIAEQRAALEDRVGSLGGPLESGLSAQFRAIEKDVRAANEQVKRFREARVLAGTATPEELAGLDALTAKAIRLGESLKDAERSKVAARFADSLRDIDSALAGLGSGLRTGLDATIADIDANVQGVLDRIAKAREEAASSGAVLDTSALDAAAAKAILLGDALKLDAQAESAREYLSVLAEIGRQGQAAALTGLPEAARAFGEASIELRAAQADAQARIIDFSKVQGIDPEQAKRLADQSISALQREFDDRARKLTLEFVLRPQIQVEEEELRRQLEGKLAPFAKRIQEATDARNASFNPDTGQFDPEKVRAVEDALRDARIAAQEFNQEILSGAEALEKGFSAGLRDRIVDATNDFTTGAKLASTAFDSLGSSLGDSFFSIVEGSKSAKEAIKDFVKSFVADIARAISQALAFRLVAGSLGFLGLGGPPALSGLPNGGVGFAARGGVFAGEMLPPRAFAEGGIMPGSMQVARSILHDGKRLPVTNYAVGGIARAPQAAIFAEKPGMAEAFVPLPGPDRGIPVEFKNLPERARRPQVAESQPTNVSVSVNYQITALDAAGVREMLLRESRTIEDVIASAVSSGTNRGLTESVRSAGNPARG